MINGDKTNSASIYQGIAMSQEFIDVAVFGLMLGATALAAIKVRSGASRNAYTLLSGFALLSAVSGMRLVDHLALEALGSENSGLVSAADASLTLLGLILVLRGVSNWKSKSVEKAVSKGRMHVSAGMNSQQETERADSFRKLHTVACDLARRTEALVGGESEEIQTRVSALEALFEACVANLSVELGYDCLTVELAPLDGTTAHSMTSDSGSGATKVSFYPVRQSLVQVCGMENGGTRLIRKTSGNSDANCWTRLDQVDVKEAQLGFFRLECGYTLTIAAGSRRSDGFETQSRYFFGEFLKLVRPLVIVALSQAGRAALSGESPQGADGLRSALRDRSISGNANRIKVAAPELSAAVLSDNTADNRLDEI